MGTPYEKHLDMLGDVSESLREYTKPDSAEPLTDVSDCLDTLSGCESAISECLRFFEEWYEHEHRGIDTQDAVRFAHDIDAAAELLENAWTLENSRAEELMNLHARILRYVADALRKGVS